MSRLTPPEKNISTILESRDTRSKSGFSPINNIALKRLFLISERMSWWRSHLRISGLGKKN